MVAMIASMRVQRLPRLPVVTLLIALAWMSSIRRQQDIHVSRPLLGDLKLPGTVPGVLAIPIVNVDDPYRFKY
jgi:hypothetical protein